GRGHPTEERGVVRHDDLPRVALLDEGKEIADARLIRTHVLHAEAVEAEEGAACGQLAQVVEILGIAAVADHDAVERHTEPLEQVLLLESPSRRCVRVGRDGHAGLLVRDGRRAEDACDVLRDALGIRCHLEHAGADARARDAALDVAEEQLHEGVLAADEEAGSVGAEEVRQHVARVVAGGGDELHGRTLGNPPHPLDVSAEAELGEVDDGAHAERVEALEPCDGPLDGLLLIPFGMGQVHIEFGVHHEHVLVDEGHAELLRHHLTGERRNRAHRHRHCCCYLEEVERIASKTSSDSPSRVSSRYATAFSWNASTSTSSMTSQSPPVRHSSIVASSSSATQAVTSSTATSTASVRASCCSSLSSFHFWLMMTRLVLSWWALRLR